MVWSSKYKRVLLKVSGESLAGSAKFGHDFDFVNSLVSDVAKVHAQGIEVCIVVGGGNIFRGNMSSVLGTERASSDYMGMLATVINALMLQTAFDRVGVESRVLSAIPMTTICESYIRRKAIRHLEKGRVVIFAAGTGNPFFTTDTAAVLRATEMGCDVVMKGTKVDGIYSTDPLKDSSAKRYDTISYVDVLTKDLKIMDASAISIARENFLPVVVFALDSPGSFYEVVSGSGKFTLITKD